MIGGASLPQPLIFVLLYNPSIMSTNTRLRCLLCLLVVTLTPSYGMIDPDAPFKTHADLGSNANLPLHAAIAAGQMGTVRQLARDERFDVNAQDVEGNTPLHWATSWRVGDDCVEALLEYGAVVNVANHAGQTLLDLLPVQHQLHSLLLRNGAVHGDTLPSAVEEPRQRFNYLTRAQRQAYFFPACRVGDDPTVVELLPSIDPTVGERGHGTPFYFGGRTSPAARPTH